MAVFLCGTRHGIMLDAFLNTAKYLGFVLRIDVLSRCDLYSKSATDGYRNDDTDYF